jgi:hypothetical protein
MAQTTTRKKTAKKAARGSGRAAPQKRSKAPAGRVERTAGLSADVLRSLEDGQRAAIEAVHGFVDRVDRTLPALAQDNGRSRRQEIIDSALEMADRLVHAQYEFIRDVIDSTGKSLAGSGKGTARGKSPARGKGSGGKKR